MKHDDLEPMNDELAALLRRGAPKLDASSDARARVFERVSAAIATTTPLNGDATAVKPVVATSAAKIVVPIVAFLLGGGAGALVRPVPKPEVKIVYVERSSPAPTAPASAIATAMATATPAAASASAPARTPPSTSSLHSASGMNAERAMLDDARTAFTKGDASGCLRTLDVHRDRYPAGMLAEEREALAIRALASLGRHAEASARADRFRAKYPTSVMLPAVEAAVGEQQ